MRAVCSALWTMIYEDEVGRFVSFTVYDLGDMQEKAIAHGYFGRGQGPPHFWIDGMLG